MTVSVTTTKNNYEGNGVTWQWDYTFPVEFASDIHVQKLDSDGVLSTLTLDVDYEVNGVGSPTGGTVEYPIDGVGTLLQDNEYLVIYRTTPQTQTQNLVNQSQLDLEAFEDALDRVTRIVQELQEQIDRASLTDILVPPSEAEGEGLYIYAGTAAPTDPSEGQFYLNITTHNLYVWIVVSGSGAWCKIGTITQTPSLGDNSYNLGYVPISAGSYYPLTGDLYLGTHQVKGLAAPTLGTDATTKTYVDDSISTKFNTSTGHDHDGSDSKRVPVANLDTTGGSSKAVPLNVGSTLQLVVPWAVDFVANPSVGTSYADICEVTVTLPSTATSLFAIFVMGSPTTGTGYYLDVRLQNGSDVTIAEDTDWVYMAGAAQNANGQYNTFAHKWTPGVTGSYTVTAQALCTNGTLVEKNAFLLVMMC